VPGKTDFPLPKSMRAVNRARPSLARFDLLVGQVP
jgi:hypothetical protein